MALAPNQVRLGGHVDIINPTQRPSGEICAEYTRSQKAAGFGGFIIIAAGKRHREKVGRKSDAIRLYQSRKADATAGRKLPELRDSKVLRFSELIDDALEFVVDHKDRRSYVSKAEIVRKAFDHLRY